MCWEKHLKAFATLFMGQTWNFHKSKASTDSTKQALKVLPDSQKIHYDLTWYALSVSLI